jgi:DNA-binding NtrC family response regulator
MFLSPVERALTDVVRKSAYANPFDAEEQQRLRAELLAIDIGSAEEEARRPPVKSPDPYVDTCTRRLEALLLRMQQRVSAGVLPKSAREQERYEDVMVSAVYLRHLSNQDFQPSVSPECLKATFKAYAEDYKRWNSVPFRFRSFFIDAEHSFAIFYQYRLAVFLLHDLIRGNSKPIVKLRAATWHSIFPKEMRIYGQVLYERMHDVTTLILGPSGTGKELVATAIGLARFVPFDGSKGRFKEPFAGAFHPLNLSALPKDLIESEMFGHVAGAFTGAGKDRVGWFEKCKRGHTVFLDELGELAESVQVRLLRLLQSRDFYRVGDAEPQKFEGRVIAATNRDLDTMISAGEFREDLYFRLCSDIIRTPSLHEQLLDSVEELPWLVRLAANKCLGENAYEESVDQLTSEVVRWIESSSAMGLAYDWPGNFRELEQCVRSVMVRGEYHPPRRRAVATPSTASAAPSALDDFLAEVRAGSLTFDQLLERYCSLIHARSGNLTETARRLKKHRATVQSRVKPELAEKFGKH